jgi:Rhs element Vgr protein
MPGVVTATVLSGGSQMSTDYDLISLDIIKTANKIPSAKLVLLDGDAAKKQFEISDTEFFEPGKEIEIKLRYEGAEGKAGQDATVFKGIATRHSVRANPDASFLTVELRDAAIKLTVSRKNAIFKDMKDDAIIKKLVSDGGVSEGTIATTTCQHKEMIQYYCTDWDFLLSRADINGQIVIADDGKVNTMSPEAKGEPAVTFDYGTSEIGEFEMEADIKDQVKAVESIWWDTAEQKMADPKEAASVPSTQGELKGDEMASAIAALKDTLIHPVDANPDEMKAWADAGMVKSRSSLLRGRLKIPGDASLKPGNVIKITGIGKKFNGKTLVTGVRHQVSVAGWQTDIQFGVSANWFSRNDNIIKAPSAGLLPAINGLHIGVVDTFEKDPDDKLRVKVKVPAINTDENAVWARLATPDGGNARGIFFRPETGDEVVLGFFNNDPRQPVILGSLYSQKNVLPTGFEITEENYLKGLLTRESLKLLLDDENKLIEIQTPAGSLLRISDKDKGIHLEDENGNKVTTDDKGINTEDKNGNKIINDDKGITLEDKNGNKVLMSSSGITIQDKNGNKITGASGGITLQAGQNVNIKGGNIKIEGSQVDIN